MVGGRGALHVAPFLRPGSAISRMKKNLQKSTLFNSAVSLLMAFGIVVLIYAAYLHSSDQALGFQAHALEATNHNTPRWAITALQDGGFMATLTAIILVAITKLAAYTVGIGVGTAGLLLFRSATTDNAVEKTGPTNIGLNVFKVGHPNIYVVNEGIGKTTPIDDEFLRLDRAKLRLNRPPKNAIEQLELAVQEIMLAHRDVPADPEGHHADEPLYEHSLAVAKKLQARSNDTVARVVGLAHDLGKLLAYKKNPKKAGAWMIVTHTHAQLSANLVRLMPEYNRLSDDDKITIRFVLKFYHTPELLPGDATQRVRNLMQKLRLADSLTANEAQKRPEQLVGDEHVVQVVADTILEVLPNLNINLVRPNEKPDGFTGEAFDFVAIMEWPIRRGLSTAMQDESLVRALALRTDRARGKPHPAAGVILKALLRTDLLLSSYGGVTPPDGRFSIKSGQQRFDAVFLFDRSKLEALYPEYIKHWGLKPPYKLSVLTKADSPREVEDDMGISNDENR